MNRGQETARNSPQNCSISVSGSRSVGFSSHHCSALVLKTTFPVDPLWEPPSHCSTVGKHQTCFSTCLIIWETWFHLPKELIWEKAGGDVKANQNNNNNYKTPPFRWVRICSLGSLATDEDILFTGWCLFQLSLCSN